MALPRQGMLLITALSAVIVTTRSSPAGVATNASGNQEPHIVRVVRQATFQGQSQRPRFPGTNNGQCDCEYHVVCASQLDKIEQSCQLPGGGVGVCCPPVGGQTGPSCQFPFIYKGETYTTCTKVSDPEGKFWCSTKTDRQNNHVSGGGNFKHCTSADLGSKGAAPRASVFQQHRPPQATSRYGNSQGSIINNSIRKGIHDKQKSDEEEKSLFGRGFTIKRGSPAYWHLRVFRTGPTTPQKQHNALTIAMASSHMQTDLGLSFGRTSPLQKIGVRNTNLSNMCPVQPKCPNPNAKYRTADGSCNNIRNPHWGMSETPLRRLLPPKYEDGIRDPRITSVTGRPLPLVRRLSNSILIDNNQPDPRFTLSVMQWAQFMDHDLTLTPFPETEEEGIRCCTEDNNLLPESDLHECCFPIELPRDDGFFGPRRQTCMNFVRSNLAVDHECRFGPVEQINVLTHWNDASTLYGQNQNDQNTLRSFRNGLLRTSGNNLLPVTTEAAECEAPSRGGDCYLAGDSRVNEQPGLALLHTIWVRQHNRIARQLQQLNPRWPDEAVFQETRRIIGAQITHITYNEWLPIIIGEEFMAQFGLLPLRSGFSSDYDPSINANINNEFQTAAFRFGHSLLQGILNLFSAQGGTSTTRLRDNFMTAHLIPEFFDSFIRGLTRQAQQTFDNFVTQDVSNHLFQVPGQTFGMDLMSLNIQRGRDHAIGTYNEARELCGIGRATTFSDLTNTMLPRTVQRIQQLYASVDDIDMFVGGMSETSVLGGILGPTFLCIVGDQFARLKKGDRYFYELGGQAGSFKIEQLQEIRRTSWARILCDNSDNLDSVQPLAFRLSNNFNPQVPCSSPVIPQLNLQPWRGEQPQG